MQVSNPLPSNTPPYAAAQAPPLLLPSCKQIPLPAAAIQGGQVPPKLRCCPFSRAKLIKSPPTLSYARDPGPAATVARVMGRSSDGQELLGSLLVGWMQSTGPHLDSPVSWFLWSKHVILFRKHNSNGSGICQ